MADWIVFDMDDVLVNSRQLLCRALNAHTGKSLTVEDWHSFYLDEVYEGLDQFQLVKIFHKSKMLENSQLEDHVKESMDLLKAQGFKIGILTARGWHNQALEVSWSTVKKYELPVDHIHALNIHENKKDKILEQFPGKIHAYIDDNSKHVYGIRELGINAILQDRPWNRTCLDLPRCFNLKEFLTHIPSKDNKYQLEFT